MNVANKTESKQIELLFNREREKNLKGGIWDICVKKGSELDISM